MHIRNKKDLRDEIKTARETTGELDYIEIYENGTWERFSSTSFSQSSIDRRTIGSYMAERWPGISIDRAISETFREIEDKLN